MSLLQVDLNSDMGEGFGAYRMGDDAAILDIVTSANVACGFHAGDPEIMASTFALAREKTLRLALTQAFRIYGVLAAALFPSRQVKLNVSWLIKSVQRRACPPTQAIQ
nr:LamB/YcsF family protein [Pantoea bituminis]